MSDTPKPSPKAVGGGLVALIGTAAAAMLFVLVPEEESSRKVEAKVTTDGKIQVRHISGKQYLNAYLDIAGVPTACDGIVRGVRLGDRYTEAECAAKLEKELVIHAKGMLACTPGFNPKAHPFQTVSLVSFTYNLGVGAYCGSTARRYVVAGNFLKACDWLLPWNKARVRGVLRPVAGLTKRRNRERQYCLTGIKPGYTPDNLNERLAPWK